MWDERGRKGGEFGHGAKKVMKIDKKAARVPNQDESMHSGADVEAFTAALNRDISGGAPSTCEPSESNAGVSLQASSSTSSQLFGQWQTSSQEKNLVQNIQPEEEYQQVQSIEQHLPHASSMQKDFGAEDQHQQNRQLGHNQLVLEQENLHHDHQQQQSKKNPFQFFDKNQVNISEKNSSYCIIQDRAQHSESQQHMMQQLDSQETPTGSQTNNSIKRIKVADSIPFYTLLPKLHPHLDKDRFMQLQAVYDKLRQQQAQAAWQANQNQYKVQIQASSQQPSYSGANQLIRPQTFRLVHPMPSLKSQKEDKSSPLQHTASASTVQMQIDTSFSTPENTIRKSEKNENMSGCKGMCSSPSPSTSMNVVNPEKEISTFSSQAVNKSQQQMQVPQTSFSMHGSSIGNLDAHTYPRPFIGAAATSLRPQPQNSQMRQAMASQGIVSTQSGSMQPMSAVNMTKYEMQNMSNETKRMHGDSVSYLSNQSAHKQNPNAWQLPTANILNKDPKNSAPPSVPFVKQEVVDQSAEPQSKPQVVASKGSSFVSESTDQGSPTSGHMKDETLETRPSRVGLSASTSTITQNQISGSVASQSVSMMQMHSQISSATPSVLAGTAMKTPPKRITIGQKKPFEVLETPPPQSSKKQKTSGAFLDQSIEHLNDVTAVSGVDLREEEEQLLSTPKEENRASEAARRMRIDVEKMRHQLVVTSDVRHQISMMNRKAKEEWEKKLAEEADKLRKHNEGEGNTGVDGDKHEDEGRSKTHKINREDDKMRATAANVAARAAVGGDDMLSKWQLMAEQARQKREGRLEGVSCYHQDKITGNKSFLNSGREQQEFESRGPSAAFLSGKCDVFFLLGSEVFFSFIINQPVVLIICLGVDGGMRKPGRGLATMPPKVACHISAKDVIVVLEREPQMSRSALIYRLYERMPSDSAAE
ncbi:transcription initiation factor TFIID subunit 4b [Cocos nucifera]|uniref:Transcription initiation factor TFIID subunit 4b n=1 Tax=Cocos nucifera TaxID=13894 RepID=A0A8K0ICR7_COCNU|nr:transcription initiation factor TFIID subunit 4b [Cocos nucifera]